MAEPEVAYRNVYDHIKMKIERFDKLTFDSNTTGDNIFKDLNNKKYVYMYGTIPTDDVTGGARKPKSNSNIIKTKDKVIRFYFLIHKSSIYSSQFNKHKAIFTTNMYNDITSITDDTSTIEDVNIILENYNDSNAKKFPGYRAEWEQKLSIKLNFIDIIHFKLCPLDHVMVGEHRKISIDEYKMIANASKSTFADLPRMVRGPKRDPAITWLNLLPGDIVEITSISNTAGLSKSYRLVV